MDDHEYELKQVELTLKEREVPQYSRGSLRHSSTPAGYRSSIFSSLSVVDFLVARRTNRPPFACAGLPESLPSFR